MIVTMKNKELIKKFKYWYYCSSLINLAVTGHSDWCYVEIWAMSWVTVCCVEPKSLSIKEINK